MAKKPQPEPLPATVDEAFAMLLADENAGTSRAVIVIAAQIVGDIHRIAAAAETLAAHYKTELKKRHIIGKQG